MATSAVATMPFLQNLSLEQLVSVHAKGLELSAVKVLHTAMAH
jgi:hypothetical protein